MGSACNSGQGSPLSQMQLCAVESYQRVAAEEGCQRRLESCLQELHLTSKMKPDGVVSFVAALPAGIPGRAGRHMPRPNEPQEAPAGEFSINFLR